MSTSRTVLVQILLVLCITPLWPQSGGLSFDRLNLEQGLSQGTVHCLLQDQKGFLWIGTQDGLNKYDGYGFTVFRYDREDSLSISDNWINCLFEDQQGFLWVGTLSGGLNKFDRTTGTFENYRYQEDGHQTLPSDNVKYISQDGAGNLWIATDGGISRKTPSGFVNYPDVNANYLLNDGQGKLWAGTTSGLFYYDPQTDRLTRFTTHETLAQADVKSLLEISPDSLLIGTHAGLFNLNFTHSLEPVAVPLHFPEISDQRVNALEMDMNGRVWIGYEQEGVIMWDRKEKIHLNMRYQPDQVRSLTNDKVHHILLGKFGNMWVGTLNGISKHNVSNVKFRLYQNVPGVIGHTGNSIFSIVKDQKNYLWAATREGMYRRNLNTGEIKRFYSGSKPSLQDDSFRAVYQDSRDQIWIGSSTGFVDILDPVTMQIKPLTLGETVTPNGVYCIFESPDGEIWIGAHKGLYRYIPDSESFEHYPLEEIRSIKQDSKGQIWIGTLGAGIYKFDPQKSSFQQYRHDPQNPRSLSHDIVACLYIDPFDTLWIGTASGFNKYHPNEDQFHNYSIRDGLPGEVVYGILPDDNQFLWLSTNNGLTRYQPDQGSFRTYHSSDGLQGSEFNAGAFHRTTDGELYFGGLNGINAFFPQDIKNDPLLPEVILTGFKVLNEDRELAQSLEYARKIDLSYQDYFFSFEFTALHLAAPERNRYAYKMEGFDRDWIYTNRRFANYTNLDPGTYVFKVKASNNDGVWNDKELAIIIDIAPPFWKTWWFYLLIAIMLSSLVYVIYLMRVGQIRKEEELKTEFNRKLAEVEMSALRSQMNPHFLFNSLNSINRYIVKSDPETASGYLTKFSRLIRLILQNSKSATIPLANELEALKLYVEMEDLRFENKFDYHIRMEGDIEPDYLEVPPMVIQPYVENAIWHGLMHKKEKGRLTVTLSKEKGSLKCIIEDNGIGRDKARDLKTKSATKSKSMGMKITRDRLSLINNMHQKNSIVQVEDLKSPDGNAIGTRVTLYIPIEVEVWEGKPHLS